MEDFRSRMSSSAPGDLRAALGLPDRLGRFDGAATLAGAGAASGASATRLTITSRFLSVARVRVARWWPERMKETSIAGAPRLNERSNGVVPRTSPSARETFAPEGVDANE